jgi:hypothetical protein
MTLFLIAVGRLPSYLAGVSSWRSAPTFDGGMEDESHWVLMRNLLLTPEISGV